MNYTQNEQMIVIRYITNNKGGTNQWQSATGPVVPAVVVIQIHALPLERIFEQILEHQVIWLLLELQSSGVDEQLLEFVAQVLAQSVDGYRQLLLHYSLVFLFFGVGLQVLPWDCAFDEVEQDVGYALDVVSAALLYSEVGVERGETSSTGQIFVVLVRDVVVILEDVLLGESEVNHVDLTGFLAISDDEVIGFDISVYEGLVVYELDALDHLVPHHQGGLQIELLTCLVEQIFQRFAAQVHHHHVVLAFGSHVVHVGEAIIGCGVFCLQRPQYFTLIEELRAFGRGLFQLDSVFRVVFGVECQKDLSESSGAQFLGKFVVLCNYLVHVIIR